MTTIDEIETRVRKTVCPTWSAQTGKRMEGRISEADLEALVAAARHAGDESDPKCVIHGIAECNCDDYPDVTDMVGRIIPVDDNTMEHCSRCSGQIIFGKCACPEIVEPHPVEYAVLREPRIIPVDMSSPELKALRRVGGSLTVGKGVEEIFDELRKIAVAYAQRTTKVEYLSDMVLATAYVNCLRQGEDGNDFARLLAEWMKPHLTKLKELRSAAVTEPVECAP